MSDFAQCQSILDVLDALVIEGSTLLDHDVPRDSILRDAEDRIRELFADDKDSYEQGFEDGLSEGQEDGYEIGYQAGYEVGYDDAIYDQPEEDENA